MLIAGVVGVEPDIAVQRGLQFFVSSEVGLGGFEAAYLGFWRNKEYTYLGHK